MKVCTDSCLFGGIVSKRKHNKILDIGTGTGLLSMMISQNNPEAIITAVEIDHQSALDARENFNQKIFNNKITLVEDSIQSFSTKCNDKFDLIISNPPFFQNNLTSPLNNKNLAKHNTGLSLEELCLVLEKLSAENSSVWILLPPFEMNKFIDLIINYGFLVFEKYSFKNQSHNSVFRIVTHFKKGYSENLIEEEIIIKNDYSNRYSERYISLLGEFYLIF